MNNIIERKPLEIKELFILFAIFTVVGTMLSYLYLALVDVVELIFLNAFTAIGYGFLLGFLVVALVNTFKITNRIGVIITITLGVIIINYFKWQVYFGVWHSRFWGYELRYIDVLDVLDMLWFMIRFPFEHGINPVAEFFNDMRLFNYLGIWEIEGYPLRGIPLAIIWVAEFCVMFGMSIMFAQSTTGVKLPNYDKVARPDYLMYNFVTFSDEQITDIATNKDISIILNQPLETVAPTANLNRHNVLVFHTRLKHTASIIAHLHVDGVPTEYIAIVHMRPKSWKQWVVAGKWSAIIDLGSEQISILQQELSKRHYQTDVKRVIFDENEL